MFYRNISSYDNRYESEAPYECNNGTWDIDTEYYKTCSDLTCTRRNTCCISDRPTEKDPKCYDCNEGVWELDLSNDYDVCGCPDGGTYNTSSRICCKDGFIYDKKKGYNTYPSLSYCGTCPSGTTEVNSTCCNGQYSWENGGWNYENETCRCVGYAGKAFTNFSDEYANLCTYCYTDDIRDTKVHFLEGDTFGDTYYPLDTQECCAALNGTMCHNTCIVSNNYKCCDEREIPILKEDCCAPNPAYAAHTYASCYNCINCNWIKVDDSSRCK